MSQRGFKQNLDILFGNPNAHDVKTYYGKVISGVEMTEKYLNLIFTDGSAIWIWDDGQSCCESRYMRTDNDIADLIDRTLVSIETKKHEETTDDYDEVHEIVFLEVATDKISITIASHNEHNGYYGGFSMVVTPYPPTQADLS